MTEHACPGCTLTAHAARAPFIRADSDGHQWIDRHAFIEWAIAQQRIAQQTGHRQRVTLHDRDFLATVLIVMARHLNCPELGIQIRAWIYHSAPVYGFNEIYIDIGPYEG